MRQFLVIFLLIINSQVSNGQRINFKPFIQDENIQLTTVENPLGLNFNLKQPLIVAGDFNPVTVNILDNATVVIELDAPLEYDLTVEITNLPRLGLGGIDTGITVPFSLKFAYNNTGELSDMARRMSAIEVPDLYNVVTFPMRRRVNGGPPPPPPTPDHSGYTRPRTKSYLYIYGTLGPVPSSVPSGNYSTEIDILVNYSDNAY